MILSLNVSVFGANSLTFSDVPNDYWASKYIKLMVDNGYITGVSEPKNNVGVFNPEGKLTVAELLTILVRAVAPDELAVMNNTNKNPEYWYENYYNVAVNTKISPNFYFSELEKLNAICTREEMAYYIIRAYENVLGKEVENIINLHTIPDYMNCEPLYLNSVLKAYGEGFLTGVNEEGVFKPKDSLTRAQACAVICRLCGLVDESITIKSKSVSTFNANLIGTWYAYSDETFIDTQTRYVFTSSTLTRELLNEDSEVVQKESYDMNTGTNSLRLIAKGNYNDLVNGSYSYKIVDNVLTLQGENGRLYSFFCDNQKAYSVSDLLLRYSKMLEHITDMYYTLDDYGHKIDKYSKLMDEIDKERVIMSSELTYIENDINALQGKLNDYNEYIQKRDNGTLKDNDKVVEPLTQGEVEELERLKNRKSILKAEYDEYCRVNNPKYDKYDKEIGVLQVSYKTHIGDSNSWAKDDLDILNGMVDYFSKALGYNYKLNKDIPSDVIRVTFDDIRVFMSKG